MKVAPLGYVVLERDVSDANSNCSKQNVINVIPAIKLYTCSNNMNGCMIFLVLITDWSETNLELYKCLCDKG